ncbi:helix-turn-helix transcriptional regulator [Methylorubrum aminovorans]|nr:helix-turn-helix transcriptional regulator [Methylorubrum aminovorans]
MELETTAYHRPWECTLMRRSHPSKIASIFTLPSWNAQIGKLFQSIGTPFFHEEMVDLLEATVETDAFWIIRYSGEAVPDVVFTRGVSAHTERVYSRHCASIDPFSARWRSLREAGVFTLEWLRTNDPSCASYSDLFLRAAEMDDELGITIPLTNENCFAIFLERKRGIFTDDDVFILNTLYPTIEGCCRSHLERVFNDVKKVEINKGAPIVPRPTAIFDHAGHQVYSDDSWNKAVRRFPMLKRLATGLVREDGTESIMDDWILRAERLTSDFPIAPNGSKLVLERLSIPLPPRNADGAPDVLSLFTRRERDVFRLMLNGVKNDDISAKLGVGGGSIRNIKFRIYRKLGVSSESELVSKFVVFKELL